MKSFLKGFSLGFGLLIFFILGLVVTKAYDFFITKDKSEIIRNIEVGKKVNYDSYISYPRFSASKVLSTKEDLSDSEKATITKVFDQILKEVKESNICVGGSYMLEQNIAYKDGLSVPSGYRFDSNFECRFNKDNFDAYQNLLKKLNDILATNEFIVLNIPAIKSIVSDSALEKIQNDLHDEIYTKSSELAKHYSNITKKICVVSNITYDLNPYPKRFMNADIAYSVPVENDTLERLKATVTFDCK